MIAETIIRALWPKRIAGETDDLYDWRQSVGGAIIAGGCAMFLMAAWATGWLSVIGISGFVTEVQFQESHQLLMDIRVGQIENAIIDQRIKQCLALMEGNAEARQAAYMSLQGKLNEFQRTTKRDYPRLPECNELVPSAGPDLKAGNVRSASPPIAATR